MHTLSKRLYCMVVEWLTNMSKRFYATHNKYYVGA